MENYNELFAAFDEQGRDTDRLREENEILKAQVADLLAACEALLATVQQKAATGACVHDALYGDTWEGKYEQLRAAIAKAKGE